VAISMKYREALHKLHKEDQLISLEMRCLNMQMHQHSSDDDVEGEGILLQEEIDRLTILNHSLKELERTLAQINHDLIPHYASKLAREDDPMGDYEFEVEIAYVLREDDSNWHEDSDNILTERSDRMSKDKRRSFIFNDKAGERLSQTASKEDESECYLFHDLYDHSYGLDKPSLSLKECARVGSVWVDVVIRQQYFLDVATGSWIKPAPARPDSLKGEG